MLSSMLPLVSNSSPRCSGGADSAASPRAKRVMAWGWPSSRTSKSSRVRSVTRPPFLSTTVTPKLARSTPLRNTWAPGAPGHATPRPAGGRQRRGQPAPARAASAVTRLVCPCSSSEPILYRRPARPAAPEPAVSRVAASRAYNEKFL